MSKNGVYGWAGERDVPGGASFWPWNRTVEGVKPGTRPKGGESKRSADKSAVSGAKDGGANVAEGICRSPAREFQIENLVSKRGFPGCNQLKSNHRMPRNDFFWTAVFCELPALI
ncbi:MAG: hypothetical protein DRG82_10630 [Deltaproteobacteria bacterium]|nr:MAG: hypothetical protein DRG82_10630 [Deltaproteobacteria bacterium]